MSHKAQSLFIISIATLISGCAQQIAAVSGIDWVDPNNYEAVYQATKPSSDPHKQILKYVGPSIYYENNLLKNSYYIRRWVSGAPELTDTAQIIVKARVKDWLFLSQAYSHGTKLKTVKIDTNVGSCGKYGCTLTETIGVTLTPDQTKSAYINGMALKMSGKRGSTEISIPATYFKAVQDKAFP